MASIINADVTNGVVITSDTSGEINLQANGVTKAKVTANGLQDANGNSLRGGMYRNRIINGDMRIDQRYAGSAYTSTNANIYVLDRWLTFETGGVSGRFTVQQNSGSVTPPIGFTNYLGITSATGTAVTAGMIQSITQKIEGFNASDFAWGTASAKTITISFWVRSSLTGTFGGVLSNGAVNYSYPFTYAISAANTWEYKTVTIAGPTAGTWVTNNGAGPVLQFVIGTGSTYQGSAGSWSANGYYGVTGTVDVTGTNGATLYITGVQLEVGSGASDFEFLPYDVQLARCKRYYWQLNGTRDLCAAMLASSVSAYGVVTYPVEMRANPTLSPSATTTVRVSWSAGTSVTSGFSVDRNSTTAGLIRLTTSGLTAGQGAWFLVDIGSFSGSAEL